VTASLDSDDDALTTAIASPGATSTDTTGPDGTKAAAADVVVPTKKLKFGYLLKQMNVGELLPEPDQRTVADELEEYMSPVCRLIRTLLLLLH
jgi:hypothetical protein